MHGCADSWFGSDSSKGKLASPRFEAKWSGRVG